MTRAKTDLFDWLAVDGPETLAWQNAQDQRARTLLRGDPHYEAVLSELRRAGSVFKTAPIHAGGTWFRVTTGARGMAVLAGASPDRLERVLFEAADAVEGGVILQMTPSPGGRFVALLLAATASAHPVLKILDVESAILLNQRHALHVGPLSPSVMAWMPDESGLYVVRGLDPTQRWGERRLALCRVGCDDLVDEPLTIGALDVEPQVSSDGRYAMLLSRTVARPYPSWIKDHGTGEWRPFLPEVNGRCRGLFDRDAYIAITTEGAARGRLVSIPLATPADRSTWTELESEGERVMWSLTRAGECLVLGEIDDDRMRLRLLTTEGRQFLDVPSPGAGAIGIFGPARIAGSDIAASSETHLLFTHQTPLSSSALWSYEVQADCLRLLESGRSTRKDWTTRRLVARAEDGTELPVQITHRADLDPSLPHALILTAYGGLGVADLPTYPATFGPFIDRGGIFAWATIRGGGEGGEEWHEHGSGASKTIAYGDFCAVADHLISSGITQPKMFGLFGASNGGLLVAASLAARPELFRAVVALIPYTDLLQYDRDPFAARWLVPEWGNPAREQERQSLRKASPFHNIKPNRSYPDILAIAGSEDDMSPAWHGRKLVARIQQYDPQGQAMFRMWANHGHIEAAAAAPERTAEWLSFLISRLGTDASSR